MLSGKITLKTIIAISICYATLNDDQKCNLRTDGQKVISDMFN